MADSWSRQDAGSCDSSQTLADLGLAFRDTRETLTDAIRWLVASGHMDPDYAGRLGRDPGKDRDRAGDEPGEGNSQ